MKKEGEQVVLGGGDGTVILKWVAEPAWTGVLHEDVVDEAQGDAEGGCGDSIFGVEGVMLILVTVLTETVLVHKVVVG